MAFDETPKFDKAEGADKAAPEKLKPDEVKSEQQEISEFQKAMRPNQTFEEGMESRKSLEDQLGKLREESPDFEQREGLDKDDFVAAVAEANPTEFKENRELFDSVHPPAFDTSEIDVDKLEERDNPDELSEIETTEGDDEVE
jgi:hypothetical protein